MGDAGPRHGPRDRAAARERAVASGRIAAPQPQSDKRVEPLELFFDLVFVFSLTQVTARLAHDLSWGGLLRGLRGIGGWRLSPGHFAERHSLIVIIALGESIVAVGVGAEGIELGAGELLAAALGVVIAAALWWTYFDDSLERVEARLHALPIGLPRNAAARDAFSFLHLPLVAGIVLLALGVKKTLEHVDDPLKLIAAVGLCGGAALYLTADVAFRRRLLGALEPQRLVAAAACLVLLPLATEIPAVASVACVAAVGVALVAYEATRS